MHLLRRRQDSDDFELVTFIGNEVPPYAILSHTWGDEEITYDELVGSTGKDKAGYAKIRFCSERAAKDDLHYFWVDTCCINKGSSAELSESINSMYRWYRDASICYAYIEDWSAELRWDDLISIVPEPYWEDEQTNRPLRWFTRGWTLQELIAPDEVKFFDAIQQERGTKSDPFVTQHLSRLTGVALEVLADPGGNAFLTTCHAQKMSWAAHRNTTREEDIAYCLLGIFNINMPLLYGEGRDAFIRLQEQILISSTDLSLLAWADSGFSGPNYRGIFSRHPREFQDLANCRLDNSPFLTQPEVAMTNKGARIETSLFRLAQPDGKGGYRADEEGQYLSLGCYNNSDYPVGISIKNTRDFYIRDNPYHLTHLRFPTMIRCQPQRIYLARDFKADLNMSHNPKNWTGIHFESDLFHSYECKIVSSWPAGYFDTSLRTFYSEKLDSFIGYLIISICHRPKGIFKEPSIPFSYVMTVVSRTEESGVKVTMLTSDQANRFKSDIELLDYMDSTTAHRTLTESLSHIQLRAGPDTFVFDRENDSVLRIEGKVQTGQYDPLVPGRDTIYFQVSHYDDLYVGQSSGDPAATMELIGTTDSREMDALKVSRWEDIMDRGRQIRESYLL